MPRYHSRVGVTSRLRMRGHDCVAPASSLITFCTERRLCLFGNVVDGELIPSPAGVVIDSWWRFLPARYASVELDAAIVMPKHFHAIVHLGTDPDVEAIPSLGNIVRWFEKHTTYDDTVGVRADGVVDSRGDFGRSNSTFASSAMNEVWSAPGGYVIGNPGIWVDDDYYQP